jgi:hypothetical protein
MTQATVDFGTNGQAKLHSIFNDDNGVGFGGVAQIVWDTTDANANMLKIELPAGGSVDVPVILAGIGHQGEDLTFFNGVTQPTLGVVDADRDSWLVMDFSADDAARIRSNRDIDLSIIDNSATSMTIKQGSDAYLIIDTADSSESVSIGTGISGMVITLGHATSETTVADNLSVTGDLAVDGTANLDNTDIDGTLVVDGIDISLDSTTTFNIDNSNTSNGITIGTATSGVPISIGHATSEVTVNDNLTVTGRIYLNETENCNMTTGLTINQGAAGDQILTFRGSSVNTGITGLSILTGNSDTHDFAAFDQVQADLGGLLIETFSEVTCVQGFTVEAWLGPPQTSNASGSIGAFEFIAGQHDGSNAAVDMAANSNLFSVAEITASRGRKTRMLLKADDGELHLGNATLQTLGADKEDDVLALRAMRRVTASGGFMDSKWEAENPYRNYDKLREMNLVGEKDEEGFFLFPLQQRIAFHEDAMWQLYTRLMDTSERLTLTERKLKVLEAA